jgi:predicted metal-dependent hydrolase
MYTMKQAEQAYANLETNHDPINRADAKKKIIRRLNELSMAHDIPFNKVFVRNQKTRWGSCSARKNISLNIKITRLPDDLMDYVIVHELVHIRHHNHSKSYWRELGRIVGNAKELDEQLDQHRFLLLTMLPIFPR